MTENVNHNTEVILIRLYCVVTLGDHTKWW